MDKALQNKKVGIVVANGFDEADFSDVVKLLQAQGATVRILGLDQGLVNGWTGEGWGHHFAIDYSLKNVLGVDYDGLVIPGGERSVDKLKLTAHTRRLLNSLLLSHKPVALMQDAVSLLIGSGQIDGRKMANCPRYKVELVQEGAIIRGEDIVEHDGLMTANTSVKGIREEFVKRLANHIGQVEEEAFAA